MSHNTSAIGSPRLFAAPASPLITFPFFFQSQDYNEPKRVLLAVVLLTQLATESAGNSKAGVHVGKEHGRVLFNLADVEALTSVLAACVDARHKGACQAADASSGAVARAGRVRKGNAIDAKKVSHGFDFVQDSPQGQHKGVWKCMHTEVGQICQRPLRGYEWPTWRAIGSRRGSR